MNPEPVAVFSDGKLSLPEEIRQEMHLAEGTKLRLVSSSESSWTFVRASEADAAKGDEPIWLGNRWWTQNDDWRKLEGILEGHPEHDTSATRHAERVWELEHDERKFGPLPER